jgi:hypothetical protein
MNLKLAANSITCKISSEELQQLEAGDKLHTTLLTHPLVICLTIFQDGGQLHFVANNNGHSIDLTLTIPKEDIALLRTIGRNREGIHFLSDGLELIVQVDIRNDKRPRQDAKQIS